MELDLSRLSVAEIRRHFLDQKDSAPPGLLAKLQKDPREGVRKIYHHLRNRREKEKAERRRIESMLNLERVLWNSGIRHIAGADEVGVGPLAGPVVAAAVVFPPGTFISGVDDSKALDPPGSPGGCPNHSPEGPGDWGGIGRGSPKSTNLMSIMLASWPCGGLWKAFPFVRTTCWWTPEKFQDSPMPQNNFSKGDGISFSIAAASIVAKTYRDQLMVKLGQIYPQYGLDRNKGYCTREHQEAIRRHGPSAIHRKSYTFLQELCGEYSDLFYRLRDKTQRISSVRELTTFEKEFEALRSQLSQRERRKLKLLLARNWSRIQPSESK